MSIRKTLAEIFVRNVERRRIELGLSKTEVGNLLDGKASYQSYQQIVSGRRSPRCETIEKLAIALDCQPAALLLGWKRPHKKPLDTV